MSTYNEQRDQHATDRAKQLEASTPYQPGPFRPGSFSIGQRDTYHFDIYAERRPGYVQWYYREENPNGIAFPMRDGGNERAFAIRGEPGAIYVRDERWDYMVPHPRPSLEFPSVDAAMAWITEELVTGPAPTPTQYVVGPLTMERVFMAARLTDLSDMQAVLNAVEAAFMQKD